MWINSWAVEQPDIRPKTMMTISKKRPMATVASMTKIPIAIRMRKRIFLNIVVWFIGWGCRGSHPLPTIILFFHNPRNVQHIQDALFDNTNYKPIT